MNTNHTATPQRIGPLSYEHGKETYLRLTARVAELEAALRLIAASIISADHAAEYMRGVARAALANKGEKA